MVLLNKENENVQSFCEMVGGALKLSRPWIVICVLLVVALIATNLFWACVHYNHLKLAYENTEEYRQTQDFDDHKQEQSSSKGAALGE